jgi:TonB family protein
LSSALYTKDVNKAFAAIRDLYAGITYINAPTIGAEVHLPFGGTKATGNGHREGGIGAIDFYTEWKSVYVDYSDKLQKAQIDRQIGGLVRLKVTVSPDGKVSNVDVVGGNPILAESASTAVMKWKFIPAPSANGRGYLHQLHPSLNHTPSVLSARSALLRLEFFLHS